jgi:hypothetical protein
MSRSCRGANRIALALGAMLSCVGSAQSQSCTAEVVGNGLCVYPCYSDSGVCTAKSAPYTSITRTVTFSLSCNNPDGSAYPASNSPNSVNGSGTCNGGSGGTSGGCFPSASTSSGTDTSTTPNRLWVLGQVQNWIVLKQYGIPYACVGGTATVTPYISCSKICSCQ